MKNRIEIKEKELLAREEQLNDREKVNIFSVILPPIPISHIYFFHY